MKRLEDIDKEVESCYCVLEWVARFDPAVQEFYQSYNYVANAMDEGVQISEFLQDQIACRWIQVVKDRVHIWIH